MNRNYKPLFISKFFAFDTNAIGIQSRRFVNELIKEDIKPEIFCLNNQNQNLLKEDIKINYVNEIPHRYFSSIMRRLLPDILYLPDIERFTFLPFLKKKLNSKCLNEYDWIHSISFPCSSHIAGLYLKSKTNLPWVAQFYDPWVGNSYRKYKTNFFRKLDEKIEYQVAVNADLIIHTNEIIKKDWERRYGSLVKNKIHIFPITYDRKEINSRLNTEHHLNKKVTILYVGGLYLHRNLDDLIRAINMLIIEQPNLAEKMIFKFVGDISKQEKEKVKKNNLNGLFEFFDKKHQNELANFYHTADVLLVIDAPDEENLFFPSKLVEYLTYNKPILGITPKISITTDILKKAGHIAIENDNILDIANYFRTLLLDYKQVLSFNKDYYKIFSADIHVNEYIRIIEQYIHKKKV